MSQWLSYLIVFTLVIIGIFIRIRKNRKNGKD